MAQRHMPLGYKMRDGIIQVNEDQAELVRRAFEAYASGASMLQIAKKFIEQGVPNANGKASWSHTSIGKILSNQKYRGDEFYPAIITEVLFDNTQSRRKTQYQQLNKNRNYFANAISSKYPFSGKLICGECGELMKRYTEHHSNNKKHNWKCKNYIVNNRVSCRSGIIDDRQLQRIAIEAINKIIIDQELLKQKKAIKQGITKNYKCSQMSRQVSEALNKPEVDIENVRRLIFKKAAFLYQNVEVDDYEYQTSKIQKILEGKSILTEFEEDIFNAAIKSIIVYADGRLRIEYMNGVQLNSQYTKRSERRTINAKGEKSSINYTAGSK
jgi:hypothetical protein